MLVQVVKRLPDNVRKPFEVSLTRGGYTTLINTYLFMGDALRKARQLQDVAQCDIEYMIENVSFKIVTEEEFMK